MREPKWGLLRDLHKAIKQCEPALVSVYSTLTWPGKNPEVHVYKSKGACAAFLANYDTSSSAKLTFQNMQYDLPPWSVSILLDCKTDVFNTAKVSAPTSNPKITHVGGGFSWQSYSEETVSGDDSDVVTLDGLIEQINLTRDSSDYLWYTANVNIKSDEGFLKSRTEPTLTVMSDGHALHVFVNGKITRTVYGSLKNLKLTFSDTVKFRVGVNKISLLHNVGVPYDTWNTGVFGSVTLNGLNEGTRDLEKQKWSYYKVGLKGEGLSLDTLSGSSSVEWVEGSLLAKILPLTWYKTTFNAPEGNEPLDLDMNIWENA